jgi:hypothetical protein
MAALRPDTASLAQIGGTPAGFRWTRTSFESALVHDGDGGHWALRSSIPRLVEGTELAVLSLILVSAILLALAADGLAYASLKRLFFMDVLVERKSARERTDLPMDRRTLVLFPSQEQLDAVPVVGVRVLPDDAFKESPARLVPGLAGATMIIAHSDPFRRVADNVRDEWARALAPFETIRGAGKPFPAVRSHAIFIQEWKASDPDEQRVLAQLALDGHASPHPANAPVLRHLAGRGLIGDKTLTIENHGFTTFIKQSVTPDEVVKWQDGESDVAWNIVRAPLVTAVATILGIVAISHPEIAGSGALFLPPVAAGVPAVLRAVALLLGNKGETA